MRILSKRAGDATLLIHEGVKAEAEYAKTKKLPDPASTSNAEFKCVLSILKESIQKDPLKWTKMSRRALALILTF